MVAGLTPVPRSGYELLTETEGFLARFQQGESALLAEGRVLARLTGWQRLVSVSLRTAVWFSSLDTTGNKC